VPLCLIKLYFFLNRSFRALPGENLGSLEAAILIFSPVRGFRPLLAFLFTMEKEPKLAIVTFFSFFRALLMVSNTASNDSPACFRLCCSVQQRMSGMFV
jgi:hypothetical protein